jgi:hypothetical protein
MDTALQNACLALDDLAQSLLDSYTDDRTFTELFGWNCPPLNRHDISNLAKNISLKIKKY